MFRFLGKILTILFAHKKYWLLPLVVVVVVFGGILLLTQGPVMIPLIYRRL